MHFNLAVQDEVNLPSTHRFHDGCLFMHMTEIQACPVCHIYITLDRWRIVNKYSRNFPNPDESLIKYIPNAEDRLLPHTLERTKRQLKVIADTRLDKEIYVVQSDSFPIYARDQYLYY
jgi:hypothetical protein